MKYCENFHYKSLKYVIFFNFFSGKPKKGIDVYFQDYIGHFHKVQISLGH